MTSEVRNKFEGAIQKSLRKQRKKVERFEYEVDYIDYVLKRRYNPDFTVTRKDGSVLYVEAKGYFRPEDRSKLIAVRKQNPDLDIRIVFQKNPLIKGTKSRYTDWADRHGYPCHVGDTVPKEWLTND